MLRLYIISFLPQVNLPLYTGNFGRYYQRPKHSQPDCSSCIYYYLHGNGHKCQRISTIQTYTLTVIDDYKALDAANIMTPNGDGKNDALVIKNLDMYPNNKLAIFDRSGRQVYVKTNYTNDWTGTVDGAPLAEDTYYYILDFGGDKGQIKGFVSIVGSR